MAITCMILRDLQSAPASSEQQMLALLPTFPSNKLKIYEIQESIGRRMRQQLFDKQCADAKAR
uniref:Uncharacterized protein n=1 Tax=Salix viminalis TaxID=40686 RepID=A0A6N2M0U3_SALVM